MSGPGSTLRPRYARIAAFAAAASTTLVSLVGTLVTGPADERAAASPSGTTEGAAVSLAAASAALATAPSTGLRASLSVGMPALSTSPTPADPTPDPGTSDESESTTLPTPPPEGSGTGRRVVFAESEQRVWLVPQDGDVARTYLVSGSVYDNLDPGTYQVYSRSATATGVDGSELRWMVRFAHGDNSAIGFHWIPRMAGKPMQSRAQLGTPLSHGCIRQAGRDARALWRFAAVGTTVVVTP